MTDLRQLFDDLVRFETILWNAIDTRLLQECNVSLGSLNAMQVIASTPSCRVQDIARAVAITVGGASQAVDRLEAAGRCVRHPNPDDRRSSILDLTPERSRAAQHCGSGLRPGARDLPRRPAVEERARSARHGARHRARRGHPGSATAEPRPGGRRTTRRARVTPSRRTHVDTSRFTKTEPCRQARTPGWRVPLWAGKLTEQQSSPRSAWATDEQRATTVETRSACSRSGSGRNASRAPPNRAAGGGGGGRLAGQYAPA